MMYFGNEILILRAGNALLSDRLRSNICGVEINNSQKVSIEFKFCLYEI